MKNANSFLIRCFLSVFFCVSFTQCQSRDFHDEFSGSETTAVVGTPDARQIPATLKAPTVLMSQPGSGTKYCTLPAGSVSLAKYEKGHYRIFTKSSIPCAQGIADSYRGWVPAAAVEIGDDAYFGKLRRVKANSAIDVEMNYAGNRIFCTNNSCRINEPLYGVNRCFVHPTLHSRIQDAAIAVGTRKPGYKLVMLDCYRPVSVQYIMAALVRDPQWVAQPRPPQFGGHNGGIAVDVTLKNDLGQIVDMGSGFDEFSSRSVFKAAGLSQSQRELRQILRDSMKAGGLKAYDGEWWHFSLDIAAEPLDFAL